MSPRGTPTKLVIGALRHCEAIPHKKFIITERMEYYEVVDLS